MTVAAAMITACAGEATSPFANRQWPAEGRWDLVVRDGAPLVFPDTQEWEGGGGISVTDSIWLDVASDRTVRYTRASHDTPGNVLQVHLAGRFRHPDGNDDVIVLEYDSTWDDLTYAVRLSAGGTRMATTYKISGEEHVDAYVLRR
jgi:hypothetical protein